MSGAAKPAARVLWIAAAPPARERAAALHDIGIELLHLDAGAGSADWARSLVHDALVVEREPQRSAMALAPLLAMLRAATHAPLLLIGRPADEAQQTLLYELGLDDQLDGAVGAALLAARLAALLRRWGGAGSRERAAVATVGELSVDRVARCARWRGRELALRPVELDLLHELARRAGQAVPREAFGERGHPRTLDVQVSRLRRGLAAQGVDDLEVLAVAGHGYRLTLRAPHGGALRTARC